MSPLTDGDKWWMEYHGSAAGGGGTNTSAHGTGKYEGMTLKGQNDADAQFSRALVLAGRVIRFSMLQRSRSKPS